MTETKKQEWNSNLAFMMAMIGSAVGLGNIWRFPNVLYSNGGGSFMIPYIVSLFLLGISFVLVEYAVGFKFKKSIARIMYSVKEKLEPVAWFILLIVFLITTYYVFTEMKSPFGEKTNDAFPGFYFGVNSVIYNRTVRIVVSIFISAVCVLFFIPLIDLFPIQWSNAIERRQLKLDEEEYQRGLLNEKLIDEEDKRKNKMEDEVWDDEKYDKEDNLI